VVGLRELEEKNTLRMISERALCSSQRLHVTYRGEIVGVREAQSTQTLGELVGDDLGPLAKQASVNVICEDHITLTSREENLCFILHNRHVDKTVITGQDCYR
jgi:hypothetical protein